MRESVTISKSALFANSELEDAKENLTDLKPLRDTKLALKEKIKK